MQRRQRPNRLLKRLDNFSAAISLLKSSEFHILRNEFPPGTPRPLRPNSDEPRPAGAGQPPASPYGRAYLPPPCLPSEIDEHQTTPLREIVATPTVVCLITARTGHQHSCRSGSSRRRRPANQHCRLSWPAALNAGVTAKAAIVVRRLGVQRPEPTRSRDPTPGNARLFSLWRCRAKQAAVPAAR